MPEKTARTHNLGVLFADESSSGLMHPFFAAMLNAFKEEAEARGYDITFINHNIGAQEMTFLEHCRYRNVDGVCLACVHFDTDEIAELVRSEIPCITIDYAFEGCPSVFSDNESGMRQLVDYAVSLGHRRIAFIHGQRNSIVTETRIDTFRAAMAAHGCKLPKEYLVAGRYDDLELIRTLVAQLLELPEPPTCILLPDDSSFFGAQEVARKKEIRVPTEVSFAGYDGIRLTQSLHPRLTTIRQDSATMGREAARRLIEKIENPDADLAAPVMVPVELLKGETMGWCNVWSF